MTFSSIELIAFLSFREQRAMLCFEGRSLLNYLLFFIIHFLAPRLSEYQ
jgi:hypothetical protein